MTGFCSDRTYPSSDGKKQETSRKLILAFASCGARKFSAVTLVRFSAASLLSLGRLERLDDVAKRFDRRNDRVGHVTLGSLDCDLHRTEEDRPKLAAQALYVPISLISGGSAQQGIMMLDAVRRQGLRVQVIGLRPFDVTRRDPSGNQPVVAGTINASGGKLNLHAVFQINPENLIGGRSSGRFLNWHRIIVGQ